MALPTGKTTVAGATTEEGVVDAANWQGLRWSCRHVTVILAPPPNYLFVELVNPFLHWLHCLIYCELQILYHL